MAPGLDRKFPRCTRGGLGAHPGLIEEFDEGEGEQHEQEEHPREQHHDRKHAAEVRVEGDVAEAERGHHRERPVEARNPGVLLTLAQHQQVEADREEDDHRPESEEEAHEYTEIANSAPAADQCRKLCGKRLEHTRPSWWLRTATVSSDSSPRASTLGNIFRQVARKR